MQETATAQENNPWRTCFFASALSLFLMDMDRLGEWKNSGEMITDGDRSSFLICQKFISMVEDNFTKLHTVKAYVDKLGVSQPTLSHSTRLCIRKSPLKFINYRIMREAKRMIRFGSLNMKEIASSLGFEDFSYFVRMFKREAGMSPAEFKNLK